MAIKRKYKDLTSKTIESVEDTFIDEDKFAKLTRKKPFKLVKKKK